MVLLRCDVSKPDLEHSGVQSAIASAHSLSVAEVDFGRLSSVLSIVGNCPGGLAWRLSLHEGVSFTNTAGTTSVIVRNQDTVFQGAQLTLSGCRESIGMQMRVVVWGMALLLLLLMLHAARKRPLSSGKQVGKQVGKCV